MSAVIAILDAGAQYGKVIDRRVRELNVHSEIIPLNTPTSEIKQKGFKAVIISGGPDSVTFKGANSCDKSLFESGLPILGICYGMQLIHTYFGGKIEHGQYRKDGQFVIEIENSSPLFKGLKSQEKVLLTHEDRCTQVGNKVKVISKTANVVTGISLGDKNIYGIQFHPEVDLTPCGMEIFKNFLFNIVHISPSFVIKDRVETCLQYIRQRVGQSKILVLLSGGIDSTVCAALLSKAVNVKQLLAVHIDNGFMRKNESETVVKALEDLGINVRFVRAGLAFQTGMTTHQVRVETGSQAPGIQALETEQSEDKEKEPPLKVETGETGEPSNMMETDKCTDNGESLKEQQASKPACVGGQTQPAVPGQPLGCEGIVNRIEVRNIPIGPLNATTTDPEHKRLIIGDTFMRIAQKVWSEMLTDQTQKAGSIAQPAGSGTIDDDFLLCQGTLRPDLIESASHLASTKAQCIKTHHNTTFLVKQFQAKGRIVEPLADFHKDEVRQIGTQLGLPDEIVHRHPFPGPGLAIRIICASEPYMDKDFTETTSLIKMIAGYHQMSKKPHALLSHINSVLTNEEQMRLSDITVNKALAAQLLPIQSVGVQGDCRTYSYVCALSTNERPDWDALFFLASTIPRICQNINRVVYVFGPQVAHPVNDVTVTYLREPVVACLREVDARVNTVLFEWQQEKLPQDQSDEQKRRIAAVSQMPVILIPIHFDREAHQLVQVPSLLRSVVIRPFKTTDFMTGVPSVPGVDIPEEVVFDMQNAAASVPGISRVLYDLTSKPPGTTEWE